MEQKLIDILSTIEGNLSLAQQQLEQLKALLAEQQKPVEEVVTAKDSEQDLSTPAVEKEDAVELAPEPIEMAEPVPAPEEEPIDIQLDDLPSFEPTVEPEPAPVEIPEPDLAPSPVEMPVPQPEPEPVEIPEPIKAPQVAKPIAGYGWEVDRPGNKVSNVISAVSLNDRVLFINTLFNEDPVKFQQAIADFNAMQSFDEAKQYVFDNFKDWNLSSEVVYRLMMAVRRKLQ